MNYYKFSFYEPYECSSSIMVSHEECFDNHELSVMIQDVIDKYIDKYAQKDVYQPQEQPCMQNVDDLFKITIPNGLEKIYGFQRCIPYAKTSIQCGNIFKNDITQQSFLRERYKDIVLGNCEICRRQNWRDSTCPVPNKRRE